MFEEQPALLIKSSTPQSERGGGGAATFEHGNGFFTSFFQVKSVVKAVFGIELLTKNSSCLSERRA